MTGTAACNCAEHIGDGSWSCAVHGYRQSPYAVTTELLTTPARRTGVILALESATTRQTADRIRAELEATFPLVTFALVAGGNDSLAFEWDEPA